MYLGSVLGDAILAAVKENPVFSDLRVVQDKPIIINTPAGWVCVSDVISKDDIKIFLNNVEENWEARMEASKKAIECSLFMEDLRLRCSIFTVMAVHGLAIVIRMLPGEPTLLENTGLPVFVESFVHQAAGLVVVAGPTGAGKTSTLASMLDRINITRAAHIVTIEDPIEYQFEDKKAFFTQREVGADVESFEAGMEEAMRQRPDIIMVGEIRDANTARAAFRAADSGHLVFATIHANTTTGAILKILSFIGDEGTSKNVALASSLVGVIAQRLLKGVVANDDNEIFVLACEVLNGRDPQVMQMIGKNELKELDDKLQKNMLSNSMSFNSSLNALVASGKIKKEVAQSASPAPAGIR